MTKDEDSVRRTLGAFGNRGARSTIGGSSPGPISSAEAAHKAHIARRWTVGLASAVSQDLKLFLDSERSIAAAVTNLKRILSPTLGQYHSSNVWISPAVLDEVVKIQLLTDVAALQYLGDVAGFGVDEPDAEKKETQKALHACRRRFLRRLGALRDRCVGEDVLCDAVDEVVRCQPVAHFDPGHGSNMESSMACRMVEERALRLLEPTEERNWRQSKEDMKQRDEEMEKEMESLRQRVADAEGALAGERSRSQSGRSALESANAELFDLRQSLKATMGREEELRTKYVDRGKELQNLADKIQGHEGEVAAYRAENVKLKAEIEKLQAALREAKSALWEADVRRRSENRVAEDRDAEEQPQSFPGLGSGSKNTPAIIPPGNDIQHIEEEGEPETGPPRCKRQIQAHIFLPSAAEGTPAVGHVTIDEVTPETTEAEKQEDAARLQRQRRGPGMNPLDAAARLVEKQVPSRLRGCQNSLPGNQPPLRVSSVEQRYLV